VAERQAEARAGSPDLWERLNKLKPVKALGKGKLVGIGRLSGMLGWLPNLAGPSGGRKSPAHSESCRAARLGIWCRRSGTFLQGPTGPWLP